MTGLTSLGNADETAPERREPGPAGAGAPGSAWREALGAAIESEVLPRLLGAHQSFLKAAESLREGILAEPEVEAFVALILADGMEEARAMADRVVVQEGRREGMLNALLKPAACRMGLMWERDECDFMAVTLGVYRLDQIMKESAAAGWADSFNPGFDHRILLMAAPGEQHHFGIDMVADGFRESGWCVRCGHGLSRARLMRLVREEWFDVIGFSVSAERWLKGLATSVRAVRRASSNPGLLVMVGGIAIASHPERTRFIGADVMAKDTVDALLQATIFLNDTIVTGRQHRVKSPGGDGVRALKG